MALEAVRKLSPRAGISPPPVEARPSPSRLPAVEGEGKGVAVSAFAVGTLLALAYGIYLAARNEYTPEEGVGYWLGIVGGSMMLVLLAYPLRKRLRILSRAGSAPAWFRLHMILGIVGPVLILYHCNFSLGATNSNVALFAMLTVALSGVAGRYLYGRIHNGLYGARTNLADLLEAATALISEVERDVGGADGAIALKLSQFGESALQPRRSVLASITNVVTLWFSVPLSRSRIMADVNRAARQNASKYDWSGRARRANCRKAHGHVRAYFKAVVKASELGLYERLFALWHVLHVPLFFLLIITGVAHVIAVHWY